MDLQKFKQTYTRVISESANERELKNYIRSIVEEVLKEGSVTTVSGTINDKEWSYQFDPNKGGAAYHEKMLLQYNSNLSKDEKEALISAEPWAMDDGETFNVILNGKKYTIEVSGEDIGAMYDYD